MAAKQTRRETALKREAARRAVDTFLKNTQLIVTFNNHVTRQHSLETYYAIQQLNGVRGRDIRIDLNSLNFPLSLPL